MQTFSHKRPVRNEAGDIISHKPAPAIRITRGGLSLMHGPDKNKQLVVSLKDGDLIELRPARTSRSKSISAFDLYDYLIRLEAGVVERQKREDKKAKKEVRLARLRQERAEKRLFRK
jgi:hypothetical protein